MHWKGTSSTGEGRWGAPLGQASGGHDAAASVRTRRVGTRVCQQRECPAQPAQPDDNVSFPRKVLPWCLSHPPPSSLERERAPAPATATATATGTRALCMLRAAARPPRDTESCLGGAEGAWGGGAVGQHRGGRRRPCTGPLQQTQERGASSFSEFMRVLLSSDRNASLSLLQVHAVTANIPEVRLQRPG